MEDVKVEIKEVQDGSVITPQGFRVAGVHTGVKRKRNDLGIVYSEIPAKAAAVYTLNQIQAAPITVTKESITKEQTIQAVVVNSGNANACTGEQGLRDAYEMRKKTAEKFLIPEHYVSVASTGIIGLEMPMDNIMQGIEKINVGKTAEDASNFEESILTTDTFNKSACFEAEMGGKKVTIGGAAKGSGMIKPNMATMLGFITTDIAIEADALQKALKIAVDETFNCITVDGDTSTNDMVLVLANGQAKNDVVTEDHAEWPTFVALLTKTCEQLAKQIARDGEGATKLIEVEVDGAKTEEDAKKIAKTIVGSSLVKTAVYGADANWGRIIAAVGYSGVEINPETIDISLGSLQLLKQSEPVAFSEEEATNYLENDEVKITVHLHDGEASGKAWGCDLTYDYVRINASYRS
ncbi:MAG TPA: bifunctional ornithine acetyltransferase/N-acetylglutamate synthase [Pseudogracilibacillus sp.]|nr:bifunctional ornithine acetyltransferase/N-acetylglutamate synthase [Pseudogracilibacillus sp.]